MSGSLFVNTSMLLKSFILLVSSCDALNPNRSLIRAISQQQQHAQAFQAYPPNQYASVPGFSPQAKNMNSVSPMIIMSKLTCHVNAILKVGAEGAKLQDMLVSGDVSLCYAMGMRGLVGKEAINPWKCVGVEIPVCLNSLDHGQPYTDCDLSHESSLRTSSKMSQSPLWEPSRVTGPARVDVK